MFSCTGPLPRPVLLDERLARTQRPLIPEITPPSSRVPVPSLNRLDPMALGIMPDDAGRQAP